ncbi:GntR family transcriptional regulator [Alicyclobacillaceae bacterium I2511]|nr:GntR family transcriptional regulator [Alicyclobacillaceae bacterium I2511]
MIDLDRSSSFPLYLQVKQGVLKEIEEEHWKEGDLIKPENDLAHELGVNRLTVRQALTDLAEEGVVVRIRGKGTFVAHRKVAQSLSRLSSFSEDMLSMGMKPSSEVLKMEIREASTQEVQHLSLIEESKVFELRRLRKADGIPMGIETSVLPYNLVVGLTKLPFGSVDSLYVALREICGIEVVRAEQSIEAVSATTSLAKMLGVKEGMPLLKMLRVTYSPTNKPVEWVHSFYRGDRYILRVNLKQF